MYTLDRESGSEYVDISVYSVPDLQRPLFDNVIPTAKFEKTKKGESFGPSWSTHWFKVILVVPERFKKYERVEFHWDAHNEGLVYTEDGEPVQGLTGGGERVEYLLPKSFLDGKPHTIYVEMSCNAMFGNPNGDTIQPPDPNRYFNLSTADIVAPNIEAQQLNIDFWILGDAAREFPTDSVEMHKALNVATEIMNTFESGNQDSVIACRKIAQKYLGKRVDIADVYKTGTQPLVYATGHCHIDCCWLWPFAETKRKVARSWASQCELIDRYDEHHFTASSAQQYHWLETMYPKLFKRVKAKVNDGRFETIGGSWVEHDTNMPSGESLVRQFLLGQRYFESRFGARCKTFWLPDTFGYSAQLPQLCRLAGMTRFLTQKLSWNNINKFPHTTFNWIALDGSQVICHMPPAETYTSMAHFGDVKRSVTQHKSLDNDDTSLLVFGHGDGGGGPTAEHIEKLRRCRGISDTVGLLPRVHMGDSVETFFDRLEARVADGQKLATWYGELYFELHRGTYTTQSNNKRFNRKAEILMRDLETVAAYASITDPSYKYPKKDIDEIWQMMCLCQFHDCLPGSSIAMAYEESGEMYKHVFSTGERLLEEAAAVFGIHSKPGPGLKLAALNTEQWDRTEVVEIPHYVAADAKYALVSTSGPGAAQVLEVTPSDGASVTEIRPGVFLLQNQKLRATIIGGHVTSLIDLATEREVIPEGRIANQLVIMDDKPLYWQAWDVEVYHIESRKEIPAGKVISTESGPLKASVTVETKISDKSTITTIISLTTSTAGAGSYLEFDNTIEWHETMKFLKVEFPVDVHNTEASYETQYGIIRRPTHYNTTWDMAKFEVCCHKWADLSEHGFGVSILNDCKYGFATVGNLMRLSLIRAPKAPDPNADIGRHSFRYAILPHSGPVDETVIRTARDFNNTLRAAFVTGKQHLKLSSAIRVTGASGIILDAVKRGEDDSDIVGGDIIRPRKGKSIVIRLYESLGGKSTAVVESALPVKGVWKTNLLEDDLEEVHLKTTDGEAHFKITLRPFEVVTYRLEIAV
ncbi:glycosyl hydrolases family 38 N-terminal domain-containing protein [Peziza echinospora]|nr:glycosyl hydrolases family 38 N-terminal domain-containing protein [Peziza echinospora]